MRGIYNLHKTAHRLVAMLVCLIIAAAATAEDQPTEPRQIKHRITGLFSPDRQDDLRKMIDQVPDVKLVSIDYENAEATFAYDPPTLFADADAEQLPERFTNLLRSISPYPTFAIHPLYTGPREKLQLVEIGIVGHDCKGCSFAAYEAIYEIEGVERATASFKEGLVTARIDSAKTDRAALEAALKAKGVQLKDE